MNEAARYDAITVTVPQTVVSQASWWKQDAGETRQNARSSSAVFKHLSRALLPIVAEKRKEGAVSARIMSYLYCISVWLLNYLKRNKQRWKVEYLSFLVAFSAEAVRRLLPSKQS
jgi:hypothetical protein